MPGIARMRRTFSSADGNGRDTLVGGDDTYVLTGGDDTYVLTGGGGADVFVFATGDGADTVADFKRESTTSTCRGLASRPS